VRLQLTITETDEDQWSYLHSAVLTEYEIPADASRVCLTFTHGEEERHAEMPMGSLVGLLLGLGMVGISRDLQRYLSKLKPTDLSTFLNQVRREADPALKVNRPCDDHGSPVVRVQESQFPDAPPVRIHKDGCQSYGPYDQEDRDAADLLDGIREHPSTEGPDK
jgi:hypothetical protein